jgi:DNA-binding MarR family transcriptional regulator
MPKYTLDEQIGFLLRICMQRHTTIFMSRMIGDLTQTQFAALARLLEVGPCSQNHLGRLIYLDTATIKGVIDRLRARKLVVIRNDPDDRRRRTISLTEAGRRLIVSAIKEATQITEETLEPLTVAEAAQITRLLQKLS